MKESSHCTIAETQENGAYAGFTDTTEAAWGEARRGGLEPEERRFLSRLLKIFLIRAMIIKYLFERIKRDDSTDSIKSENNDQTHPARIYCAIF